MFSLQQRIMKNLEANYEKIDSKTSYPYGRNRGDVRSVFMYRRNDGAPIPSQDIALFKELEAEQRKDSYAALSGIYTHKVTDEGLLQVNYYRHTSG